MIQHDIALLPEPRSYRGNRANAIVISIIDELNRRAGFDNVLDTIDNYGAADEIKRELYASLCRRVLEFLP